MLHYPSDRDHKSIILWVFCLLNWTIRSTHSQDIYQSLFVLSNEGMRYAPANEQAQFIASIFVDSWKSCAVRCNMNPSCQVYDYNVLQLNECRIFEGDVGILGQILPSQMLDSMVGTVQTTATLFSDYGQPCSSTCMERRYLICSEKLTCECIPHTYWDASTGRCLPQVTISGAPCNPSISTCQEDYNLTCTPLNQCADDSAPPPPPPEIISNTIADRNTVIEGSSAAGLEYPVGIAVYETLGDESLIVTDTLKNEIVHLQKIYTNNKRILVLARNWTGEDSLNVPSNVFIDTNNQNDLYVADSGNHRILLFTGMQATDPLPVVAAGITGSSGSTPDRFTVPYGIAVDSERNLYVADHYNQRVMRWTYHASSGIMIAGTGTEGNGRSELQYPIGLFLGASNSLLYVADRENHRIQLFNLTDTPPYEGITIAGGNGPGPNSNQLYYPADVWVSKKTGYVYIADTNNHRIQCWRPGETAGFTVAGNSNGISGVGLTGLSSPSGLTVNKKENRIYVSDTGNGRIQWFPLS